MRIGLYGLPCSGKSYFLKELQGCSWNRLDILCGSDLLFQEVEDFRDLPHLEKVARRKQLAKKLQEQDDFIMDGHHSFGDEVVFTEEDGSLYDVFCYLYLSPEILAQRMAQSEKNWRYNTFDLAEWQQREIASLRGYCHQNSKDFYVLDSPPLQNLSQMVLPLDFFKAIQEGYSVVTESRAMAKKILSTLPTLGQKKTLTLCDGDKTLTMEDTSGKILSFRTNLFDGNFYTGYQQWQQFLLFQDLPYFRQHLSPRIEEIHQIEINHNILQGCGEHTVILTSGHPEIWEPLSGKLGFPCVTGSWMCADAKFFMTKFLQEYGVEITSFGDSMNDYFMLRQADFGYLVRNQRGEVSRSLRDVSLEGLTDV